MYSLRNRHNNFEFENSRSPSQLFLKISHERITTIFEQKSGQAFLIAAYASFFAWLARSFAVRAFVDSLHLLSKLLGGK